MKCPFCAHADTQVKDSRPGDDGATIRRRRYCPKCEARFTTFEQVQQRELSVLKSDGKTKPFDRNKIARSLQIALRKRPVEPAVIERTVNMIVRTLEETGEAEIPSRRIGKHVMDALKKLDEVAYIRYASVYRNFREAEDFEKFMEELE